MILNVITTVGTSLITNYMAKEVREIDGYDSIDSYYKLIEKIPSDEYATCKPILNDMRKIISGSWVKGIYKTDNERWKFDTGIYNENCCAEIKTLLKLYKVKAKKNKAKIRVYLLTTDTVTSNLAAEIIKENINNFEKNIMVKNTRVIKGLQTESFERFESEGINNLFGEINKTIQEISKREKEFNIKESTIINISGGYKALIPYMTIFAQLYELESVYIYEDSDSLITIPPLPIQIDWGFAEEFYPYLSDPNFFKEAKLPLNSLINQGLLTRNAYKYSRTSMGQFFYKVTEKELHVSRNVMGFFFEYKLYEYYITNPYGKYINVEHSVDKNKYIEMDLVLNSTDCDYIAIEVKSLNYLDKKGDSNGNSFTRLKKKIQKHLNYMKRHNDYAKEYHLCIYTPNENVFTKGLYSNQIWMLKELEGLFKDTKVKFKAYMIKANYRQMHDKGWENSNPYQQLMKDRLVYGHNFKEIKF